MKWEIYENMVKEGKTQSEVARICGVSRQCVNFLLKHHDTFIPKHVACIACKTMFLTKTSHNIFCNKCSNDLKKTSGRERTREVVRIRDNHTCRVCKKV